ncbi:MAG TPA: hypothetical protein VNK04_01210 [Gemmataceae bacterium]|nr:hypothetical protein [Gemmataceae bacterium]
MQLQYNADEGGYRWIAEDGRVSQLFSTNWDAQYAQWAGPLHWSYARVGPLCCRNLRQSPTLRSTLAERG